jgi:PIN domain nuclease of toxin-antitoxin system
LDTHIFIWWNGELNRLSLEARAICESEENTLTLSLASVWEMQIKFQLGKLDLNQPLPEIIHSQQRDNAIELLPIRAEHIYALGELPVHHKDPFDRLLIAQARTERMHVLTADPVFHQYHILLADGHGPRQVQREEVS